jgi:hypothetical protein
MAEDPRATCQVTRVWTCRWEKTFTKRFSGSVTILNLTNRHLLLDNSLTFGGFHYSEPREIFAQVRYAF